MEIMVQRYKIFAKIAKNEESFAKKSFISCAIEKKSVILQPVRI